MSATAHRVGFGGLLSSEWIKLWSLRSTWWCFGIAIVLIAGIAALVSGVVGNLGDQPIGGGGAGLGVLGATAGVAIGQLVVAVLGVLVISGEYSTGQIRSTFAAAPHRTGALLTKAFLFGLASLLVGLVALGLGAALSLLLLPESIRTAAVGDSGYWLALLGAVGNLALPGVIAVLLGAILRNVPAGIATVVGLFFVVPVVLSIIGGLTRAVWPSDLAAVLPAGAGSAMSQYPTPTSPGDGAAGGLTGDSTWTFLPWQGLLIMLGWVVLLWIAAQVLTKRRDV